jgi:hypothetical protein
MQDEATLAALYYIGLSPVICLLQHLFRQWFKFHQYQLCANQLCVLSPTHDNSTVCIQLFVRDDVSLFICQPMTLLALLFIPLSGSASKRIGRLKLLLLNHPWAANFHYPYLCNRILLIKMRFVLKLNIYLLKSHFWNIQ